MADDRSKPVDEPLIRRVRQWTLAGVGVLLVAVGAVGAVVPGLPTTVFLLLASACFTKSCPWLEDRLIRNRLFAPYVRYLNGEPMPPRIRVRAIVLLWCFVIGSAAAILLSSTSHLWIVAVVIAAAIVGTIFILMWNNPATPSTKQENALASVSE